jgi:hypothetical protein
VQERRSALARMYEARFFTHLTKTTMVGLFALTSSEANALPRSVDWRRDGRYTYKYKPVLAQAERAWDVVGGSRVEGSTE